MPSFHAVLHADCCYAGGGEKLQVITSVHSNASCVAQCQSVPRCAYISWRADGVCALCATCSLRPHSGHFSSWARDPLPSPVDELAPLLQGGYSMELYGAPGRVDGASLRLVWLQMLPPDASQLIASKGGVCKYDAGHPWRPFLIGLDLNANPIGAMWISLDRAMRPSFPIPNHSWIEVTHCPQHGGMRTSGRYGWQFGPMWLYAAPGSGVSINVGRTVAMSYADAARLLRRVYPGTLECACESGCQFGLRTGSVAAHKNGSSCISSRAALVGDDGTYSFGRYERCWTRMDVLAEVDTIQVIEHMEYYGRERRNEIVHLRHYGECGRLNSSTPGLMCGRFPYLVPCAPGAHALQRVGTCASSKVPLSSELSARVNFTGRRCARTSDF